MMKHYLLTVIFMTLAIGSYAAEHYFNIGPKDGSVQMSIPFSKSPVINYEYSNDLGASVVVSAEGVEPTAFLLYKEYTITYTESETPTAVKEAVAASKVSMKGGMAVISGLKADTPVSVYAADGAQISAAVADSAGVAYINLSAMPKGVVVIKAGSESFKLKK